MMSSAIPKNNASAPAKAAASKVSGKPENFFMFNLCLTKARIRGCRAASLRTSALEIIAFFIDVIIDKKNRNIGRFFLKRNQIANNETMPMSANNSARVDHTSIMLVAPPKK